MGRYSLRDGKFTATKVSVSGKVPVEYTIPETAAESTSAIITGENLHSNGTTAYTNTSFLVQPPYPMQLHLNWNAAGSTGDSDTLIFVGKDALGEPITDTLTISSAAAGNAYTSNAYAKLTSVTPSCVCKTTDIGIGYRKYIGLPFPIDAITDVISYTYDGATATTANFGLTLSSAAKRIIVMPTMADSSTAHILYLSKVQ